MGRDSVAADQLGRLVESAPEEQARCLLSGGDVDPQLNALADEADRWAISDLDRALEASRVLVVLADALGASPARVRTRRSRAHALAYANRFDDALSVLGEAIDVAERSGASLDAAQARLAMLHPLARLGRYDHAIAEGRAALDAFHDAGEGFQAARACINLGVTYRMNDDPREALSYFDQARDAVGSDPVMLAQLDSNRAEALLDLDRFAESEEAFRSALGAFRTAGLSRGEAIVEGNLADLMSRQGRLQAAFVHFERARRHLDDDRADGDAARLEAEQAELFAACGLHEEAVECYMSALPRLETNCLVWEAARAQAGLGRALARLRRSDEAEAALAEAAEAFHRLGHEVGYGRVRLRQGSLALERGADDEAVSLLTEALQCLRDRPADAAVARHHLARLAIERGDLEHAGRLLDEASAAAGELELAPLMADLLHTRAALHRARGRANDALAELRRAVREIEKVRGTLQAERVRAAFFGDRTAVYGDLVAGILDAGRPGAAAAAFAGVEQAKSRTLLDLVAGAVDCEARLGTDEDDAASPLVAEVLLRRRELNALYSRVHDLASGPGRASHRRQWRDSVDRCARGLRTLESRLAATRGVGGLFAPPADLASVQLLLGGSTVLVEYFMARGEVLAFTVGANGGRVHRGLTTTAELESRAERLHFHLRRAVGHAARGGEEEPAALREVNRELRGLHDLLIGPLEAALEDATRLVIVPHGVLHSLPFHALFDGRRHLIERYEIVHAPSASLLRHLDPVPRRDACGRSLVFGVADETAPRIGDEARRVAGLLDGAELCLDDAATSGRLAEAGPAAGIVHLACHGRFLPGRPLASGLRLGDGWLTVRDLYGFRFDGAVIVLSGCDTGRVAVGGGDELVGLVRGFFAANASALLLSLWPLHDAAAGDLVESVYASWRAGTTLASALRAAQLETMRRRPHPVFWAPLMLVGRPCTHAPD